jgi:hypothetical protein
LNRVFLSKHSNPEHPFEILSGCLQIGCEKNCEILNVQGWLANDKTLDVPKWSEENAFFE